MFNCYFKLGGSFETEIEVATTAYQIAQKADSPVECYLCGEKRKLFTIMPNGDVVHPQMEVKNLAQEEVSV